jgi:regulator of replication initiation timing
MIHKFFDSVLGLFGYIPRFRERLLVREILNLEKLITNLEKENLELKDENASLWDMLDEIKKSDMSENKEALKSFVEDIQEIMTDEMLKDFKPIGEA